jgi:predicted nucleic acid-binding Zn ribbon protein
VDDKHTQESRPLGDLLGSVLRRRGLAEAACDELCAFVWREVAGEWYARHTYVTSVREGVVNVHCDSAPRAQQLQLDAPEIIRRLNERLGANLVRELRPSSAGLNRRADPVLAEDPAPDWPTPEELARIPVAPEDARVILETVGHLEEPARGHLERAMLAQVRLRTWQLAHGWRACPGCGAMIRGAREFCLACRPPEPPSNAGGEEGLSGYFR